MKTTQAPAARWHGICGIVIVIALVAAVSPGVAGQTESNDLKRVETVHFWPNLYRNGGETLFIAVRRLRLGSVSP